MWLLDKVYCKLMTEVLLAYSPFWYSLCCCIYCCQMCCITLLRTTTDPWSCLVFFSLTFLHFLTHGIEWSDFIHQIKLSASTNSKSLENGHFLKVFGEFWCHLHQIKKFVEEVQVRVLLILELASFTMMSCESSPQKLVELGYLNYSKWLLH